MHIHVPEWEECGNEARLLWRILMYSLNPTPCTFVACSMKFAQKAWSILSYDVCCSICRDHTPKINDVIGEVAHSLALKETPRDHSYGSCAKLLHVSAKSLGGKRTQAVIFSWIVDSNTAIFASARYMLDVT